MKIERREQLSPDEFVQNHLAPGRPVIVTDAMRDWRLSARLNPATLHREFGRTDVLVYDHLFDLQDVRPLGWYLEQHFNKPHLQCHPYIRAYSQLRAVEFVWADGVFERLAPDWASPYFLPASGYAVPFHMGADHFDPARHPAPYRGLFVSGKGARTRLHRDPFTSSAMLCQFHGQKRFRMWSPEQAPLVMNGDDFVDPNAPDPRFAHYAKARVSFDDILNPGEIIFIPGGWFHDVACLSDSISITWNFVHRARLPALLESMRTNGGEKELEVVQYFLQAHAGSDSIDRLAAFLERHAAAPEAAMQRG